MPGKKPKKKAFSKVEAVKAMARAQIGAVPPAKVVPDKKKKKRQQEKHRSTLEKLLNQNQLE